MHTKDEKLDHAYFANKILCRLETHYGNLPKVSETVKPEDSLPVARQKELTRQLQNMTNPEVHSWHLALDNIFRRGEHWCPNIAEVCFEMRAAVRGMKEDKPIRIEHTAQTDYAGIWNNTPDLDRIKFFKQFTYKEIPSATQFVAKSWFKKNGFTSEQITEMIND